MVRLGVAVAAAFLTLLAAAALPQRAAAEIDGDCEANIAGESVGDHDSGDVGSAIEVDPDSPVEIEIEGIHAERHKVDLEILGLGWTIVDKRTDTDYWADELTFSDFRNVSVGLYKVTWEATGPEGSCRASALIRVPGSPFGTAAGITATVAIALGLAGLILSLRFSINAGQDWVLKVEGTGVLDRDREDKRWRLRRSLSLTGTLSGVLTGAGIVTLLQQAALRPPTLEFTLELVLPLTLIGALLLPFIGFNLSARRQFRQTPD